jgi:lipopolysaccharide biosynthesis glycosyltransferase
VGSSIRSLNAESGGFHFAFAAEGAYSVPLATAIASLLQHLRPERRATTIWILDLEAEPGTRQRVERTIRCHGRGQVKLRWLPISHGSLGHLETAGHLVPVTYARLLLPSLLPSGVDRVIYLDSDLVVMADLSELSELELGTSPLAAVPDYSVQRVGAPRSGIVGLTSKSPDATYFNGGVMVLNLDVWRSQGLADQILSFAHRYAPLRHSDQDALNAVVTNWTELPLRWNVQSNIHWLKGTAHNDFELRLAQHRPGLLESAAILHFSGPSKPWQPWYRNPDASTWRRTFWRSGALRWRERARWWFHYYPERSVAWGTISVVRRARQTQIKKPGGSAVRSSWR